MRASISQETRFKAWLADPTVDVFALHMSYWLEGDLDVARLASALDRIVDRHPVLARRFVLAQDGGVYLQPTTRPALAVRKDIDEDILPTVLAQTLAAPHSPDDANLVRFTLYKTSSKYLLHLECSHMLVDGISRGILLKELSAFYNKGTDDRLAPAPQFEDWAAKQRERLSGQSGAALVDWWRNKLGDSPAVYGVRLLDDPVAYAMVSRTLTPGELGALESTARKHRATPFAVLMAALARHICLSLGVDKLAFLTSYGHRESIDSFGIVGLLASRTFIPLDLDRDVLENPRQLISTVQDQLHDALEMSVAPYVWIRSRIWPDIEENIDEDSAFPDVALNEHWIDQLTLDGVAATPIIDSAEHRSQALGLRSMRSSSALELVVAGPGDRSQVQAVFDGIVSSLELLSTRDPRSGDDAAITDREVRRG